MESSLAKVGKVFRNVSRQIKDQAQEFNDFCLVMRHIWETLATTKNWRKVFKGLTLLEYLIRHGPERVVDEVRDRIHRIRSLTIFQMRESGVDKARGVREKAGQIEELVTNTELLRVEREKAKLNRDRYVGMGARGEFYGPPEYPGGDSSLSGYYDTARAPSKLELSDSGLEAIKLKEKKRIQHERDNARKERERQKEKQLKRRQSSQAKPTADLVSSTSFLSSDSELEIKSQTKSTRKRKGVSKESSSNVDLSFFNTEAVWGPSPSTQSFGTCVFLSAPSSQALPQPQFPSQFPATTQQLSFPIQQPSSHKDHPQWTSLSTGAAQQPPGVFGQSAISPSEGMPQPVAMMPIAQVQQNTLLYSSAVSQSARPSGPALVQSLIAQNLAGFGKQSVLQPSSYSKNPFGGM